MADWSGVKVDPSDINGGKEYEAQKDRVSIEAFNAIVNNSIYSAKASAEALEKADSAFQGNGTIVRVDGVSKGYIDFDSNPQEQLNRKESVEVIYDMDGGSPLDWGKTGGIVNGTTITGRDFSKYKRLRCFLKVGSQMPIVEIDLDVPDRIMSAGDVYNGTDNAYYVESLGQLLISINVSKDKTSIEAGVYYSSLGNSTYFIYKIEGVY